MLDIIRDYAHPSNYSRSKRSLSVIKYIVIHYTGNDGDTDEGNINYFKGANRGASAHYFVDDDSIRQSVPDDHTAWHSGGSKYNDIAKTGGASLHGKCTNSKSIGVEMCDTVKDGKYNLSVKTRSNTINLVRHLMKKYNVPIERVVRHFDVTGKYCPRYFCPPYGSNAEWNKFKQDIVGVVTPPNNKSTSIKVGDKVKLVSGAKQYDGKAIASSYRTREYIVKQINRDRVVLTINNVVIYAVNIKDISLASKPSKPVSKDYLVRVTADGLNIRAGASTKHKINGVIRDKGVYTIVDTNGKWGKLKSGAGWIHLDYTRKV